MDADATLDTPETSLSPARQRLLRFADQLHGLEGLVRTMGGRLAGMADADRPDIARIKRVIASAALLAREAADAGTLTARELEAASAGAKPISSLSLMAIGHEKRLARPRRRIATAMRSSSLAILGASAMAASQIPSGHCPWWLPAIGAGIATLLGHAAPQLFGEHER